MQIYSQNTFGGRAPPDRLAAVGPTSKGDRREERGDEKRAGGFRPKVEVSRMNTLKSPGEVLHGEIGQRLLPVSSKAMHYSTGAFRTAAVPRAVQPCRPHPKQ